MNTLILLAIGAAIGISILSYRYLKWQAMVWFGVLLTATAGSALLLDNLTDVVENIRVRDQTITEVPLFMLGPEVSILGRAWPFLFIMFLCGISIIIMSMVKKSKQPDIEPEPVELTEDELTEVKRIEKDLIKQIDDLQIGDPTQRGRADANRVGGPIPNRTAREPEGYELEARKAYETLGNSFMQRTVTRLKEEISAALQILARIKSELENQPYINIASGDYSENSVSVNDAKIDSMRTKVSETSRKYQFFVDSLKLNPAEEPDWQVGRTTLRQLIVYGGMFALIEFVVSWYFLKGQLGNDPAVRVAGIAVIVIGLLSFSSAAIFQFMRRGQSMPIRALASAAYAFLLFAVFCGFGLLLDYRDVTAKEGVADFFDHILSGYASMLDNVGNLALFLINLFALSFFYWKSLLFFDRYHGYSNVEVPFRNAQQDWDGMYRKNENSIQSALDHASDRADENSDDASHAFSGLQEKKTALEDIESIVGPAYVNHLHKSYREDIQEYRDSNRERRTLTVHPIPEYFNKEAEFCGLKDHFAGDHQVAEFLEKHKKIIEQAAKDRHAIQQATLDWQNKRQILHDEWTKEFHQKVNKAGQ